MRDFGDWYAQQYPRVHAALAVISGSPELAADAAADAFVRAYERWDRVSAMASPGGWLYRVALNNLRRRTRRRTLEAELLRRNPPSVVQAPASFEPEVWAAVRGLPDRQRTAVALRYVLDLTEAEVATVMGSAPGTTSATLVTARRRLQAELGGLAPSRDREEAGHG